nr:hypothetical protein [Tanacetum cinerariifolium]
MFYKNFNYEYLLWEDFLFQIKNKDDKNTNKMLHPRFTKIIIDYFMSKDQSISQRNKMFWHTAQDDTMFNFIRSIFRLEKTQVYGAILPKELTNQAMLESKAYKTYYAFASREKTPKPKYVRKKADSDTSPKQKPVQATKGTRIKTKAKVEKSDKNKQPAKKPKAKGLAVLSKVALTEAKQLKLATKRRKKDFHISHESGLESCGDSDEEDGDKDNFEDDVDINDDDSSDNDESDDEKKYDEEFIVKEGEKMDEEEYDEVTKELYKDLNVNLGNNDAKMTDAGQSGVDQQNASQQSGFEQEDEDTHVILTHVLDTQKTRVQHKALLSHPTLQANS